MSETYQDKTAIKDQAISTLQLKVNEWIQASHRRSLASLSRESNVSESALRRLLNNSTWPSQDNVYKLISFMSRGNGSQNIGTTLSELPEAIKNQIKFDLYYLDFKEMKKYVSLSEKDSVLKDFAHQTIFERSSISTGIQLNEIRDLFGAFGLTAVENLKTAGLVEQVNEQIICHPEFKFHSFSTQMTKDFLSQAIKTFYKTETNYNYIFNINEGVTTKAYDKIMSVLKNTHQAIFEIIEAEPGDIPLAVGGFMDTLTANVTFEKKTEPQL